jgi:hypothetical protein
MTLVFMLGALMVTLLFLCYCISMIGWLLQTICMQGRIWTPNIGEAQATAPNEGKPQEQRPKPNKRGAAQTTTHHKPDNHFDEEKQVTNQAAPNTKLPAQKTS